MVSALVGCKKELSEVPEAPVVVRGLLYGGEQINDIYLERVATTREFQQQVNEPIIDADVSLEVNGQIVQLTANPQKPGFYMSEDSVLMDANYKLMVNVNDLEIEATCYVPPRLEIMDNVAADTVLLNPSPSDLILSLSWELLDNDTEYLISLTPDSEAPELLSFDNSGQFQDVYALPIRDNFAELDASYFTYKGSHTITVFSITKEYSEYLNYLPTSFDRSLYAAPNNIVNGYGVFAGLTGSTVQVSLAE